MFLEKQTLVKKAFAVVVAAALAAHIGPARPETSAPEPPAGKLAPGQPIPAATLQSFVDRVVDEAMLTEHIAGVDVAVVQNGQTVLLKGYGSSHLDPARPVDPHRTAFRIGSISKTFTWILLMREVERGRLDLDAPINRYLPAHLQIPDQGFDHPIRPRDLMSHAAGFENANSGRVIDATRFLPHADYLVRHRPERVREPGLLSSYSNYGVVLAGYIVARLNGLDYETLIERDILAPLGLANTTFRQPYPARDDLPAPMPARIAENLSAGFGWNGVELYEQPLEYITVPSGSAWSTAADMARYMLMQLNGGSIDGLTLYGAQTARAFRAPIMNVPEGINGWAHGYMVTALPGGFKGYGHSGGTLSFMSHMILIPDLSLGVFVTANTGTGWPFAERVCEQIVEHFYAAPASSLGNRKDSGSTESLDAYAGRYLSTGRDHSGLGKFKYLSRGGSTVAVASNGDLVVSGQLFAPDGVPGRFRSVQGSDLIVFARDANGHAVSYMVKDGTRTMERASWTTSRQVFAALATFVMVSAFAIVIAAAVRVRRNAPRSGWQRRWDRVSLVTAALWLIVLAELTLWMHEDALTRMYRWPSPALVTASSFALIAAVGSLVLLALLPRALHGLGGWSIRSKACHMLAATAFVLFSALLAAWGGLSPWSW